MSKNIHDSRNIHGFYKMSADFRKFIYFTKMLKFENCS